MTAAGIGLVESRHKEPLLREAGLLSVLAVTTSSNLTEQRKRLPAIPASTGSDYLQENEGMKSLQAKIIVTELSSSQK